MNLDKKLLHYLLNKRRPFLVSIVLMLLTSAAIVWQAALLSRIINSVFLEKKDLAAILPFLLLFLSLAIVRAVTLWGSKAAANKIAEMVKNDLRIKLSTYLFRLGPAFTRTQQSGDLKNTLVAGVESLDAYFSEYLPQLVMALFIPLLILIFVFPVDLLSGCVFLFTAPLIPFFMVLIGDIAQRRIKKQWTLLSRMSAHFLDVLQGLTTLKILGRSTDQTSKIKSVAHEFRSTTMNVLRIAFLLALVLEMLASISTAIIAVEIGLRLLYGRIVFEQALFVLIVAPEFYQPLRQLGARFHAGMQGFTAAKSIFNILETQPQVKAGFIKPPKFSQLHFQNVSYTYPGKQKQALRDVNFTIAHGQHIALVGRSGAGKTTLISLLLRFFDPASGSILIDGSSLVDVDVDAWRQQITWVPQHPFLFHQSIADNLRLARPQATDAELKSAAQRAHIHDLFATLPNGYDTIIGERGARLSGGQAQRLALARAFLKETSVIILDEPTSYLDRETEALIQKTMTQLAAKTIITIAHRLHTVQRADKIILLEQGEIVDVGQYQDLLARCPLYATLVHSQEILA
ncbi:thiol reductant ABC exporter subunit CydD [candidate division KSB1 bacterium]|nr:thiol reductant ABC exporter subunit CydD [candidate division KSB1 bacterium]RQW01537.1 MAG: thiol reductant ABC exporter subunit CydD [candidate division KSB1 bacterium]